MILHQVTNSLGNYNYNSIIYHNAFFPQHFHRNYELIYVFDQTVNVTINGTADILYPGELLLLSPYTIHSLAVTEGKTWVGVFSDDHIVSFAHNYGHSRYSKFRCQPSVEAFLREHLFLNEKPELLLCVSCLYMACSECVQNATTDTVKYDGSFMHNVIHSISQNINNDIHMKDMAESLNYEYHYFSSLFHQHFHMNFKQFINLFRFEQACDLLSARQNTMSHIAQTCGFGSIRNFNRVFKELSGLTPKEYQAQLWTQQQK